MNTYHVTKLMGSDQLRNSFGKNDTMGPLKGISPFASKIFKSILFAVCHTSVMKISSRIWCSLKRYLLIWWLSFFSLNCCLTVNWYCYEKLENQSILRVPILSLIQSSAHLMIIPWFPVEPSRIFFFILLRDLTSLKKVKTPKWIEKKSTRMREKKKEEKMGMSTITQRSNHQRKERKTSQNQSLRLKSLPLRRKRFVSLLITILYCSRINQ